MAEPPPKRQRLASAGDSCGDLGGINNDALSDGLTDNALSVQNGFSDQSQAIAPQSHQQSQLVSPSDHNLNMVLQKHVLLLLAYQCPCHAVANEASPQSCQLPHCQTMRNVLRHLRGCQLGTACRTPHCHSSRRILGHLEFCNRANCAMCRALGISCDRLGSASSANIQTTGVAVHPSFQSQQPVIVHPDLARAYAALGLQPSGQQQLDEYYRTLTIKIYEIQKDFKESRSRRKDQQRWGVLVQNVNVLRQTLIALQPLSGRCCIKVSRERILEETYNQIMKLRPTSLRKLLEVKFHGEEGLDYGGLAREWLSVLCHKVLDPSYNLFQYSHDDVYTLQINPDSGINRERLLYFRFVGRIIGMAICHGLCLDGRFTMPFYKQLLGKTITLDDLKSVDPTYHQSLVWILNNEISDTIDCCFCVDNVQNIVHDLKPGGRNIPVTEENKKEYVELYVNWRLVRHTEAQFLALQKGFNELISPHLLQLFDAHDLELVISGLSQINVDDWKKNTRLEQCTPDSTIVKWFWRAVEEFSEERRAHLLRFVTGSSRVPLQGFKALQGSTRLQEVGLFTISQDDANTNDLPMACTCLNRIDIPQYESYETFLRKLTYAVEETCGFMVE